MHLDELGVNSVASTFTSGEIDSFGKRKDMARVKLNRKTRERVTPSLTRKTRRKREANVRCQEPCLRSAA